MAIPVSMKQTMATTVVALLPLLMPCCSSDDADDLRNHSPVCLAHIGLGMNRPYQEQNRVTPLVHIGRTFSTLSIMTDIKLPHLCQNGDLSLTWFGNYCRQLYKRKRSTIATFLVLIHLPQTEPYPYQKPLGYTTTHTNCQHFPLRVGLPRMAPVSLNKDGFPYLLRIARYVSRSGISGKNNIDACSALLAEVLWCVR